MAGLRRMYARLLFVVVGIVGAVWPFQRSLTPAVCGAAPWLRLSLRIYAGGMNEAIRPAPDNPLLAAVPLQLSVIVPTFNERENVATLFQRLEIALAGVAWE